MMNHRTIITLLVVLMALPVSSFAAKVPDRLQGIGMLLVNPQFRKDVRYEVRKEPATQAAFVGHILFRDAPNPTWAVQVHAWEEKNPDAGWFGPKTKQFRTQNDLDDYRTQNGMVGVYVYGEQGVWLQTQYGWVNKHDAKSQRVEYVTWKEVFEREKQFPEFVLPDDREMVTDSHLNAIRTQAYYAPIGKLPVVNDPSGGHEIITAQAPLKFAITAREGDWLQVVAVLDPCVAAKGQTDYREGTRGWVPVLDDGKPTLYRTAEGCE